MMFGKIRFDTRNVKPKVWNILAVCVLSALVIAGLSFSHFSRRVLAVDLCLMATYAIILVLLWDALRKQLEYNPYSYNTIYYSGFGIFVIIQFILLIVLMNNYGMSETFRLFHILSFASLGYAALVTPFLILFSVTLIISNIVLIRKEGKRFVNLLGIILSVLILAGILAQNLSNFSGSYEEAIRHDVIFAVFESFYMYYVCMITGVIAANLLTVRYEPDRDKDFIIILGCGLRPDGTPTPLLAGRIEKGMQFYHEQIQRTGKHAKFITSGGQGPDEAVSESLSMKNYLLAHGIPEADILMEDRSVNTLENMRNAKEIIDAAEPEAKVIFATSRYHIFRSGLKARFVKLKAQGIGADTKWYFWPNAAVREFIGLLTEHRGKQLLIFAVILIFNVTAALLPLLFM